MPGITIANICFVMAATGAKGAGPTGVAIVLGIDVSAPQKIFLLLPVNASRNVPESMGVGIDETMAGGDISRRPHPHEAEGGATRMRFVHTLMQLRKSIADIREAVHFAAEGIFQILVGQYLELGEHIIHATLVNRVKPVRRGGYRRETDFVEAQI